MSLLRALPLLICAVALAEDRPAADPITDHLRYELAAAQRDYVLAKQQLDQMAERVKGKLVEAQKACGEQSFDSVLMKCTPKPESK